MKIRFNFFHFLIPILLFIGALLIYKNIYQNPRNWYDHSLYLTRSIINGRVDIPDLPQFYHDKLEFKGKTYIPFPPGASFLLIPFILIKNNITQQQVSIIIGALNVILIYLLLCRFTTRKNSILLSIFFGFGTPFFWSAVVGTTWFFAHVASIFYLLISLLFHFNKKHLLSGIFFALAAITRLPMILAGMFYLFQLFKNKRTLFTYLLGALLFIPIFFYYNWARFGNIFEMGYQNVYKQYAGTGIKYSIGNSFGYFDHMNIPLHLYTFLIMPPTLIISDGTLKDLRPSAFGLGILFTSPLLFLALKPMFKKGIELQSIITAFLCSLPSF